MRSLSLLLSLFWLAGMAFGARAQIIVVGEDKSGPVMLSATVLEEPLRTNRIQIKWNEYLIPSTALTKSNITVILTESNIAVNITNVQYNPGTYPLPDIPPTVTLTMSTADWHSRSNYYILANNIRDGRGNVIAPNSIVPVTWSGNQVSLLPTSAPPILSITRVGANGVQVSWPTNAYSFALDWTTNISMTATGLVAGPWCEEQPSMANPFVTNPASDTHRIYRLRKTQ